MLAWIDANPWLSVALFFVLGSLCGLLLRKKRRGKYESREAPPTDAPSSSEAAA